MDNRIHHQEIGIASALLALLSSVSARRLTPLATPYAPCLSTQVVVDKFLDAVFEWRRAGSEAQTHEEVQLAREMEGESVNELARKIISSFDHQSGRDVYIRGLNRQRGAQKDVGAYFDILAESLEVGRQV